MARLLADENIHATLIESLRATGHDVEAVAGTKLTGAPDEQILGAARSDERILLTADKDFGLILEWGPLAGEGRVLLLRYHILNWERIAQDVSEVLARVEGEYKSDPKLLVVLSESGFRVRHTGPK